MSAFEKFVSLCLLAILVGQIGNSVLKVFDKKLGVIMAKTTELEQEFPSITLCALVGDESFDVDMSNFSQIQSVEEVIMSLTYPRVDGKVSVILPLFSKQHFTRFSPYLKPKHNIHIC